MVGGIVVAAARISKLCWPSIGLVTGNRYAQWIRKHTGRIGLWRGEGELDVGQADGVVVVCTLMLFRTGSEMFGGASLHVASTRLEPVRGTPFQLEFSQVTYQYRRLLRLPTTTTFLAITSLSFVSSTCGTFPHLNVPFDDKVCTDA